MRRALASLNGYSYEEAPSTLHFKLIFQGIFRVLGRQYCLSSSFFHTDKQALTTRPRAWPAHDMHMQVMHLLPAMGASIHHHAETAVGIRVAALLLGQFGR